MTNIKTNIRGIQRNTPDAESDMGSAQEIINMRHRDGAWRAIGKKQKTSGSVQVSNNNKQIGWYHHPSNVDSMLISFDSADRKILVHNTLTGSNVVVKKRDGSDFILPLDETFNCFGHLENVLILFSSENRYYFISVNDSFELVEFPKLILAMGKSYTNRATLTWTGDSYELSRNLCIADYMEKRSNDINVGAIEGITMFRAAIELFDGTYINYTDIKVLYASGEYMTGFLPGTQSQSYNAYKNVFYAGSTHTVTLFGYTAYLPAYYINSTDNNALDYYIKKGIIKSVKIFATKPLYPSFDEPFIYYLKPGGGDTEQTWISNTNKAKNAFPTELDPFFEIKTFTKSSFFAEVATQNISAFANIDSRERLPADNFTYHDSTAKYSFIYNKRLHLQQIYNKINANFDNIIVYNAGITEDVIPFTIYLEIVLEINNKSMVIRRPANIHEVYNGMVTINNFWVFYPDFRAKEIRFTYTEDGVTFYVDNRTSSTYGSQHTKISFTHNILSQNYSMTLVGEEYEEMTDYTNTKLDPISLGIQSFPSLNIIDPSDYLTPLANIPYLIPNNDPFAIYTDTNRLQLSELSNPFVFPVSNSYRFGDINNEVNGIEVTHEQLSETRFGEYPLYVFTTQGVFALKSGSGSIVYSSLDYLKKHKVTDHQTIMNSKGYVVFRTDEGFFALSGREFTNISTPVQGSNVIDIQSDTKFQSLLDGFNSNAHNHLSINNFLNNTDFIACHDHVKDELWLSLTSSLDASYIFSFDTKSWFKSAETFQYFVDLSPDVVGIKESIVSNVYKYDFYDMHKEDDFSDLKLFVSRPITFGSDYYKRIEHFVSRLRVEQSGQTVLSTKFYLYGSINGFEYKLLQGGEISDNSLQDQEIRRCFVDFKYLIIVLGFNHEYCEVVGFESEIKEKFKTKLR